MSATPGGDPEKVFRGVRFRATQARRRRRWFDSDDLQSITHLASIVEVAEQTPGVRHWLPTKERALVARYLKDWGPFPSNLVVRISAAMFDTDAECSGVLRALRSLG